MECLLECFLRAVTGAGPAVPTAAATAGPAQATAFIKQSESFPTGVLQLMGSRCLSETDKIRTANLSSVNLHRVPLKRFSFAGFHHLDFVFGFANVEFMVWISYHDILMRISGYGFPIWIAYCGFQCLDVLSGCTFRFSKRGNQVDG